MDRHPKVSAEWLMARVREGECGCLIWTGYSQKGSPKANLGKRSPINVRRLVWASAGNNLIKGREIICTCGTINCVALEHLKQVTRSEKQMGIKRPHMAVVNSMLARRATSKLPDEVIPQIRESDEPIGDIAARFGCSRQYVHMIRKGECRRDVGNPFAGLMR